MKSINNKINNLSIIKVTARRLTKSCKKRKSKKQLIPWKKWKKAVSQLPVTSRKNTRMRPKDKANYLQKK